MAYTVMHLRSTPEETFWGPLRDEPGVAIALALWAAAMLAIGSLLEIDPLMDMLPIAL